MALPLTITPQVGASLITRVTRLFNGTIHDVLNELLQNSRRAGASAVNLDLEGSDGAPILVASDDGSGIDDPVALLTLGYSGWNDTVAHREDPAGMGMFSLAGRQVEIRSWSRSAGRGWMVEIPEQGWQSPEPLAIQPCAITGGTQLRIALPDAWAKNLLAAARNAARYFPLPVTLSGTSLPREDFLAEAARVETWQGCRIGIFSWRGYQPVDMARINFHGLTVPCDLPFVSEVGKIDKWCVKVDIIDAPDLQLVLPARKELVRNAGLDALKIAAEAAIYRMICDNGDHRLGFTEWARARALGIMLPHAAPWLPCWAPMTADSMGCDQGEPISSPDMLVVPAMEIDLQQGAAPILNAPEKLGMCTVRIAPGFSGYDWYDRLPRLQTLAFVIEQNGLEHMYEADTELDPSCTSGRADAITLELGIADCALPGATLTKRCFPLEMLVCRNEGYDLDDAIILIGSNAVVSPDDLAWQMELSLFRASDDSDCDSWETQQDNFQRSARNNAYALLLSEEEALLRQIRDRLTDKVQWLIPPDRTLKVTATRTGVELTLEPAP